MTITARGNVDWIEVLDVRVEERGRFVSILRHRANALATIPPAPHGAVCVSAMLREARTSRRVDFVFHGCAAGAVEIRVDERVDRDRLAQRLAVRR